MKAGTKRNEKPSVDVGRLAMEVTEAACGIFSVRVGKDRITSAFRREAEERVREHLGSGRFLLHTDWWGSRVGQIAYGLFRLATARLGEGRSFRRWILFELEEAIGGVLAKTYRELEPSEQGTEVGEIDAVPGSGDPIADIMAEDHRSIFDILRRLKVLVASAGGDSGSEKDAEGLLFLVTHFQERLKGHFRMEEEQGPFREMIRRQPRLAHGIDEIRGEHRILEEEVGELRSLAEHAVREPAQSLPVFRGKFASFTARLHDHEIRENNLLFDAYNTDIGSEG